MSLRDRQIPSVIRDILAASKSICFCESRGAARDEGSRLIVTESSKSRILAREGVIELNVKLTLV